MIICWKIWRRCSICKAEDLRAEIHSRIHPSNRGSFWLFHYKICKRASI